MDYETVFGLADPYLKRNDFGMPHTRRVFDLAKQNFVIPKEVEELVFCSIIMHDIGGSTIEKQYQQGPEIAASILRKLGYDEVFVQEVCEIVCSHHDHPDNPSLVFRILYDSDKLVMFSPEEFPHYNSKPNFDWNQIVDLIYHENVRDLAKRLLKQRRTEAAT
ncbi:HD domain-containing protein [Candidatus Bathyarchaeota archaeon]|nr:HD domain-containing protein [Candidatus Bathyarchaeota archaeon]